MRGGGKGAAGQQAERKIVDEVVGNPYGKAGEKSAGSGAQALRPAERGSCVLESADAFNGLHEDEKRGDERERRPADAAQQAQRVGAGPPRHGPGNGGSGEAGG